MVGQFFVHRRDQVFLGVEARPGIHGAKQQIGVAFIDAHGFGGEVRPSDLDHHIGDFGKLAQPLFDPLADFDGVGQRYSRQLARFHQNGAFVQLGHEFGADEVERSECDTQRDQRPLRR